MSDSKDTRASVKIFVRRYEKRRWEAWVSLAGSNGVTGQGETEKAAKEDLERNLAWATHYVGAFVALDGSGMPWICTVAACHGAWIVRRATPEGMSGGITVASAASYSALLASIATWNKAD